MCFIILKNVDLLVVWYANTLERSSLVKITYKKQFLIKVFDIDHLVSFEIYDNQFFLNLLLRNCENH